MKAMINDVPEKVKSLVEALKSGDVKIPISRREEVIHRKGNDQSLIYVLFASPEFTDTEEGRLIYIQAGAQHGILRLFKFDKDNSLELLDTSGIYERDDSTRMINAIYLPQRDVFRAAYQGSFEDLLKNENIRRVEK